MKKYISKLHYLTQDLPHTSHLQQAQNACESGANWIQYRCMSKSDEEMLAEINQIAEVCDDWGATLIITNHAHLVPLADIQGVHIEDMEANLNEIRKQIGADKTLGASATNVGQVKRHIEGSADYIGYGPFSHTDTKPNDYQLLGIKGYKEIMGNLIENGLEIAIIAVGGITLGDVEQLLKTTIHGVAISSAINKADDPKEMYKQFHKTIF